VGRSSRRRRNSWLELNATLRLVAVEVVHTNDVAQERKVSQIRVAGHSIAARAELRCQSTTERLNPKNRSVAEEIIFDVSQSAVIRLARIGFP
jgi:hypothetical protein